MRQRPISTAPLLRRRSPELRTLLKLGAALTLSVGLVACGGSSDPAPSRVAQARFGTMQALDVSRVSVLNQDGKELYAQSLNCEQVLNCRMPLPNYVPPTQLSFKLYDTKNQLVSVSDVYRTDQDSFYLPYSDTMLGTYLFRSYAKLYDVTPMQLSVQLAKFFQNTENLDGTPDHFIELGKLYQKVRQDPKLGYSEAEFYAELKKRLDSNVVLKPGYIHSNDEPVVTVARLATSMASATAEPAASCPPGLEVVAEVASEYGKFIPYVGDAVGKFIGKAIGASVNGACDQSDKMVEQLTEINAKLDEIKKQIQELEAKVVALGYRIEQLQEAVYQQLEGTALGRFYDDYNKIASYTSTYHNMLNPLGKAPYKNLGDYAKKNGGLKQSNFGSGTALYALLRSLAVQNQSFKGLALKSNLDSLATAIKLKCEDETQIIGDVVDKRGRCNLLLGMITSEFSQAQAQLALLMKDEIAMIYQEYQTANATDRNWIELTFVSPFTAGWDTAQVEVNQTLTSNLSQFGSALGGSYVPVLKGLAGSVQLGLNLSATCRTDDTPDVAAVSAWYPNESPAHLTAHCYNDGKMVKSKLQYSASDEGSLYRNILGVPVVARTSDRFTDRNTLWTQTGPVNTQYEPWDDHSKNGLTVKLNPTQFKVNNEPFPPKWIMSPMTSYTYAETCHTVFCKSGGGGSRYVMLKDLSLPADSFEYFTSRLDANEVGEQYIAATVSYTTPAGTGADNSTTIVWQVELQDDVQHNYNGYRHPFQSLWRLRCLTADCSVDGNDLKFANNSAVGRVSLTGARDGWKSFVISRY